MIKHIPNILTFSRLVLTLILLVMILYAPRYYNNSEAAFPGFLDYAFLLFIVSAVTDFLDGWAARKFHVESKLGRMMDPLVDKVLVCGAFLCFAIIGQPKLFNLGSMALSIILWLVLIILVAREAYVTILRHIAESKGINFAATKSGKFKMFVQSFAIALVIIKMAHFPNSALADGLTTIVFLTMIYLTVYSGLRATRRKSWQETKSSI